VLTTLQKDDGAAVETSPAADKKGFYLPPGPVTNGDDQSEGAIPVVL
jgi:hypothetical protein